MSSHDKGGLPNGLQSGFDLRWSKGDNRDSAGLTVSELKLTEDNTIENCDRPDDSLPKPRWFSLNVLSDSGDDDDVDPVCGMDVPVHTPITATINGKLWRFCCEGCREKFISNEKVSYQPWLDTADEFICPMCPEVLSEKPASCPRCGMPLEPRAGGQVSSDTGLTWRVIFSLAGSVGVAWLAMGPMIGLSVPDGPRNGWYQGLLATFVVILGTDCWCAAVRSLQTGQWNMFTLLGLGVSAAWINSLILLLSPASGSMSHAPNGTVGSMGSNPALSFEAAAWITSLMLFGQWLEGRMRLAAAGALNALLSSAPQMGLVLRRGREFPVRALVLRPGELVRIRPGEKIPADGSVVEGSSRVNESAFTGEFEAINKEPGSRVIGGTLNQQGALVVRVDRAGSGSRFAQLIHCVVEAQQTRPRWQQMADRWASGFTPCVVIIAAITFGIWFVLGGWSGAWQHAIAVLVIACPCAFGLAAPMTLTVGLARAARCGVLFRDADVVERLAAANMICFDKTGTLTEGKPRVTQVIPEVGLTSDELVQIAAAVEFQSEHAIAKAIVSEADSRKLPRMPATSFQSHPGLGARATVTGKTYGVGRANPNTIDSPGMAHHQQQVGTIVCVTHDDQVIGHIVLQDTLRADAQKVVHQFVSEGWKTGILSGDRTAVVQSVANEVGIREVHAELFPEEKFAWIRTQQQQGNRVVMVGDGVNDAPALAAADVGMAVASGTDAAMATAPVVLTGSRLEQVWQAVAFAKAIRTNMQQNFGWAIAYNALGIPLAAGCLEPWGIDLSPMFAALAMSLSSVTLMLNALRLMREQPQ